MNPPVFQQIGQLVLTGKRRRDLECEGFMKFFRALVEMTDSAVAKEVGGVSVTVLLVGNKEETWKIELTASDYAFWKEKFAVGVRFKYSLDAVKAAILKAMTAAAERNKLTADERKQLLALLDGTSDAEVVS